MIERRLIIHQVDVLQFSCINLLWIISNTKKIASVILFPWGKTSVFYSKPSLWTNSVGFSVNEHRPFIQFPWKFLLAESQAPIIIFPIYGKLSLRLARIVHTFFIQKVILISLFYLRGNDLFSRKFPTFRKACKRCNRARRIWMMGNKNSNRVYLIAIALPYQQDEWTNAANLIQEKYRGNRFFCRLRDKILKK